MRQILMTVLAVFLLATGARADGPSESDRAQFRSVIENQIAAFRSEDGARAWSFAAPSIQRIFPTPDSFMAMVRKSYQPVYRPQSVEFGEAGLSASGRPIQRVRVVGPDGLTYEAIYTMEQQPDGSWEISACAIVRAPDMST